MWSKTLVAVAFIATTAFAAPFASANGKSQVEFSAAPVDMDVTPMAIDTYRYWIDEFVTGIGLTNPGNWQWGIRCTTSVAHDNWDIIEVRYAAWEAWQATVCSLRMYDDGGASGPGALITSDSLTPATGQAWYVKALTSPFSRTQGQEYWAAIYYEQPGGGQYPGGCGTGVNAPGYSDWVELGGTWAELSGYGLFYDWNMDVILQSVGAEEKAPVTTFSLNNEGDNPTKGNVKLSLALPAASNVVIVAYDASGRNVATLASGSYDAGVHNFDWNGAGLKAGVYFVDARAGTDRASLKVVLR